MEGGLSPCQVFLVLRLLPLPPERLAASRQCTARGAPLRGATGPTSPYDPSPLRVCGRGACACEPGAAPGRGRTVGVAAPGVACGSGSPGARRPRRVPRVDSGRAGPAGEGGGGGVRGVQRRPGSGRSVKGGWRIDRGGRVSGSPRKNSAFHGP